MAKITTKRILKEIGDSNLSLYKGRGYWYFVYDDTAGANEVVYADHSVYVMRLEELSLEYWVQEGRELLAKIGK